MGLMKTFHHHLSAVLYSETVFARLSVVYRCNHALNAVKVEWI